MKTEIFNDKEITTRIPALVSLLETSSEPLTIDVVLDIESLGTIASSVVLELALAIHVRGNANLDVISCKGANAIYQQMYGRTMDDSTLEFWKNEDPQFVMLEEMLRSPNEEDLIRVAVFKKVLAWLSVAHKEGHKVLFYSRGKDFDFPLLTSYAKFLQWASPQGPWCFKDIRDRLDIFEFNKKGVPLRTVDLAGDFASFSMQANIVKGPQYVQEAYEGICTLDGVTHTLTVCLGESIVGLAVRRTCSVTVDPSSRDMLSSILKHRAVGDVFYEWLELQLWHQIEVVERETEPTLL